MKSSDYNVESVIVERTLEPWEVELERYKKAVERATDALLDIKISGEGWEQRKASSAYADIKDILNP